MGSWGNYSDDCDGVHDQRNGCSPTETCEVLDRLRTESKSYALPDFHSSYFIGIIRWTLGGGGIVHKDHLALGLRLAWKLVNDERHLRGYIKPGGPDRRRDALYDEMRTMLAAYHGFVHVSAKPVTFGVKTKAS